MNKALQRADESQRAELEHWINAKEFDRNEKVQAVTRLYNEMGIRELCERKINYYFEESRKCLDQVGVSGELKAELRAYTLDMMKRQK